MAKYNYWELLLNTQVLDLENELSKIEWEILRLSETRRHEENFITSPSLKIL